MERAVNFGLIRNQIKKPNTGCTRKSAPDDARLTREPSFVFLYLLAVIDVRADYTYEYRKIRVYHTSSKQGGRPVGPGTCAYKIWRQKVFRVQTLHKKVVWTVCMLSYDTRVYCNRRRISRCKSPTPHPARTSSRQASTTVAIWRCWSCALG